jgi:effector-binding domain-containing protein
MISGLGGDEFPAARPSYRAARADETEIPAMPYDPQIQQRDPQPYAGLPVTVTMETFPAAADASFPELFGWLRDHGLAPAGAPFIRYHVIDMEAELEIEFGIPVTAPVEASGRVRPGVLPAGRYATLIHVGPYDQLVAANAALQDWAQREGITLESSPDGRRWAGRVEHYLTDPAAEPDPAKWETEVAYLIT